MDNQAFRKYLATGEYVPTEDADIDMTGAAMAGWKNPKKPSFHKPTSLEQHDKHFHPNGFDPKKDHCRFRDEMAKKDKADDLGEFKMVGTIPKSEVKAIHKKSPEAARLEIEDQFTPEEIDYLKKNGHWAEHKSAIQEMKAFVEGSFDPNSPYYMTGMEQTGEEPVPTYGALGNMYKDWRKHLETDEGDNFRQEFDQFVLMNEDNLAKPELGFGEDVAYDRKVALANTQERIKNGDYDDLMKSDPSSRLGWLIRGIGEEMGGNKFKDDIGKDVPDEERAKLRGNNKYDTDSTIPDTPKKWTNEKIKEFFKRQVGTKRYKDLAKIVAGSDTSILDPSRNNFGHEEFDWSPFSSDALSGKWVPGLEYIDKTDCAITKPLAMALGAVEANTHFGEIGPEDAKKAIKNMGWEVALNRKGTAMIRRNNAEAKDSAARKYLDVVNKPSNG